jgi:large subunit ribosomal protein L15
LPKLGFKSRQKMLGSNRYCLVSLGDIEAMPGVEVTPKSLLEAGIRASSGQKAGYKILANGTLSKKVSVRVHAISAGARAKIESIGGMVELITE